MMRGITTNLLGVYGAFQCSEGRGRINCAKENGLELVHAGIGEQKGRVIMRNNRRRLNWALHQHQRKIRRLQEDSYRMYGRYLLRNNGKRSHGHA